MGSDRFSRVSNGQGFGQSRRRFIELASVASLTGASLGSLVEIGQGQRVTAALGTFDRAIGVAVTVRGNESRPLVNVRAYGAVGDGVANDASPIQNAIIATTASGGAVFFPPGTYRIHGTNQYRDQAYSIRLPSGVSLVGAGTGVSTIKTSGSYPSANLLFSHQTTNISLRNLTMDGNGLNNANPIKLANCATVVLENVEAIGGSYCVQLMGCQDVFVVDCLAHDSVSTSGGGFGFSVVDNVTSTVFNDLVSTARVHLVNCRSHSHPTGGFRIVAGVAPGRPGGPKAGTYYITETSLVNCQVEKIGGSGLEPGFFCSYADGVSIVNCTARSCGMAADLQFSKNCRLFGLRGFSMRKQGLRFYGTSASIISGCEIRDFGSLPEASRTRYPGFSLQDGAGGVGSTNNVVTGCVSGGSSADSSTWTRRIGYYDNDPNSGPNLVVGNDFSRNEAGFGLVTRPTTVTIANRLDPASPQVVIPP